MNRRRFLGLLGLTPAMPLLSRIPLPPAPAVLPGLSIPWAEEGTFSDLHGVPGWRADHIIIDDPVRYPMGGIKVNLDTWGVLKADLPKTTWNA